MAHFTSTRDAAQNGVVGDTVVDWGDTFEIVHQFPSGSLLIKQVDYNVHKVIQRGGYVPMDSFIGPEWTVERIVQSLSSDLALAAGAAKADEHERHA